MVFLIDIVQKVRRMAEKGELIVNKAESAAEFVKQASIPVAIAKGVSTLSDMFAKKSSKSDDKEE